MDVITKERGWAGHYIAADRCNYRRNTLVQYGNRRIVVSTVGAYRPRTRVEDIGIGRWYETMAFVAVYQNNYWEADTRKCIPLDSEQGLYADEFEELMEQYPYGVDNAADNMHENAVEEIKLKITDSVFWNMVNMTEP